MRPSNASDDYDNDDDDYDFDDDDDDDEDDVQDVTSLDDVLHYLGDYGLYQQMVSLMLVPFCTFSVFSYFGQMFLTLVPEEHWCKLPEVSGFSEEELRRLAIPSVNEVPNEGHKMPYSRCWKYDVSIEKYAKEGVKKPDTSWPKKRCHRWDFNFSEDGIPYPTIATELGWVCEKAYLVHAAQSVFFIGSIVGGFWFGWMADKYGRIPVLVGTNVIGALAGVVTIFCEAFWQFGLCRFILGISYDNNFTMMYILALEYVGPKWRTLVANISLGICFPGGCVGLAWMAYYIADWKLLAIATSAPLALSVAMPCVCPESVRWLVSKGNIEKAIRIMRRIQRVNRRTVPERIYTEFRESSEVTAKEMAEEEYNFKDLFKTPQLRRFTILLTFMWGIVAMVFDGHVRNLGAFDANFFVIFTIASVTTLPADIFVAVTLDHWGRRWLAFGSMFLSGLACFVACLMTGFYFAGLGLLGRFLINIAYTIGLQYAAELLPTVVRAEGVAFIHIMGYVTAIVAPFVAYMKVIANALPMFVLGLLSIIGGILCLFLPETLDEDLPQTLEEGERFGTKQRFCDVPCLMAKRVKPTKNRHNLHAKRPTIRAELLRSSIISGAVGNKYRLSIWDQQVGMDEDEISRRRTSKLSRLASKASVMSRIKKEAARNQDHEPPPPPPPPPSPLSSSKTQRPTNVR